MIIGVYSPSKRSGKSTFALMLQAQQPDAAVMRFADPMLDVVRPLVGAFVPGGESQVDRVWYSDAKDTYRVPKLNVTMRHMMQTIGTEWGRMLIHPDIWVMLAMERAERALRGGKSFVIFDDMRFENEYHAIRRKPGSVLVKVVRPDHDNKCGDHVSEGRLDRMEFDHTVINNGTVEDLRCKAQVVAWDEGIGA